MTIYLWRAKPVIPYEVEAIKWDGLRSTLDLLKSWGAPVQMKDHGGYNMLEVQVNKGTAVEGWVSVPTGYYIAKDTAEGRYWLVADTVQEAGYEKIGFACRHCKKYSMLPGTTTATIPGAPVMLPEDLEANTCPRCHRYTDASLLSTPESVNGKVD